MKNRTKWLSGVLATAGLAPGLLADRAAAQVPAAPAAPAVRAGGGSRRPWCAATGRAAGQLHQGESLVQGKALCVAPGRAYQ